MSGGRYRSTAQVTYETWRAADCRPYVKFVSFYRLFYVPISALRSENAKNVVHYRRGGKSAARYILNTTCAVEWHHLPICHPDRNEMKWRDLPKQPSLPCVGYFCNLGGFLHSASLPRNDISGGGSALSARVVFVTLHGGVPHSESKSMDCQGAITP